MNWKERRAARARWPIRHYPVGEEPDAALCTDIPAEQRLGMVWTLTLQAWAMTGKPLPNYRRSEIPGTVLRDHRW